MLFPYYVVVPAVVFEPTTFYPTGIFAGRILADWRFSRSRFSRPAFFGCSVFWFHCVDGNGGPLRDLRQTNVGRPPWFLVKKKVLLRVRVGMRKSHLANKFSRSMIKPGKRLKRPFRRRVRRSLRSYNFGWPENTIGLKRTWTTPLGSWESLISCPFGLQIRIPTI